MIFLLLLHAMTFQQLVRSEETRESRFIVKHNMGSSKIPFMSSTAKSKLQCAMECQIQDGCVAFNFYPSQSKCDLMNDIGDVQNTGAGSLFGYKGR